MRTKHLLHALAALCLFAACKKNNNSNSTTGTDKFKSYVEEVHANGVNQTDSFNLSYDNNGRITTMVSSTLKFVYAYNGSTSITMDLYENGQLSIHEVGFEKNGLLDSTFQYNDSQDTTTEGYVYATNGSNLLTRKTTYEYVSGHPVADFVDDYTYDLNPLLLKDVQSSGGVTTNFTTYTYYGDPNHLVTSPFIVPSQVKDLLSTQTLFDGQGNVTARITYTWATDSAGRVIQEMDKQDNGDYVIKRYHY